MPDRVPLKEDPTPKEVEEQTRPEEPKEHVEGLSYIDDLEYHRVADSLGIDYELRADPHIHERLSYLYDWAKTEAKSDDRLLRVEAIRNLIRSTGLQMKGKELLLKLYQYLRLDEDRKRIEREMKIKLES